MLVEGGRVRGLEAVDRVDGRHYTFQADRICNCTGSEARAFAARHDRDQPELFIPSLAFNLLLDCEPLSDHALAVAAPESGAPVYFLCPTPFGVWAGTEHVGRPDACRDAAVAEAEIAAFLGRINRAIPGLELSLRDVRRVFCGLLPVRTPGGTDLTARESFIDHGKQGGVRGFFSLAGMKFTTARRVAARAVRQMLPESGQAAADDVPPGKRPLSPATGLLVDGARAAAMSAAEITQLVRETAAVESVIYPGDFLLRRTNWLFSAPQPEALECLVAAALRVPGETATAGSGQTVVRGVASRVSPR
jgi:glycerol-3-phosphate dehydrogenase